MYKEEWNWLSKVIQLIILPNGNRHISYISLSSTLLNPDGKDRLQTSLNEIFKKQQVKVYQINNEPFEGVDVVADITDRTLGASFKNHFALTICTNMLEHVEYIDMAAANLLSVTAPNGYMLITVPYKYKIHHDPIDNGFRPTPAQIMALFPVGTVQQMASSIISISDKKYYRVKQSSIPFWGYRDRVLYYLGKRHKVSGILLKVIK